MCHGNRLGTRSKLLVSEDAADNSNAAFCFVFFSPSTFHTLLNRFVVFFFFSLIFVSGCWAAGSRVMVDKTNLPTLDIRCLGSIKTQKVHTPPQGVGPILEPL